MTYYNKNENNPDEKLPLKSINGRRCLTKCYSKGTPYLHPVALTPIAEKYNDSCAIEPIYNQDSDYAHIHDMIWADTCDVENNMKFRVPNELQSILKSFHFNPNDFLSSIYGLNSFDQVIHWSNDNYYLPFDTIKRVHNCAWIVYGLKSEISTIVGDYYYKIATNHWLRRYIKALTQNYSIEIQLGDSDYDKTTLYSQILDHYFTAAFFFDKLNRYIYQWQPHWDDVVSHYSNIKNYIYGQLVQYLLDEKYIKS